MIAIVTIIIIQVKIIHLIMELFQQQLIKTFIMILILLEQQLLIMVVIKMEQKQDMYH